MKAPVDSPPAPLRHQIETGPRDAAASIPGAAGIMATMLPGPSDPGKRVLKASIRALNKAMQGR